MPALVWCCLVNKAIATCLQVAACSSTNEYLKILTEVGKGSNQCIFENGLLILTTFSSIGLLRSSQAASQ